jgi:hypothetical protein
VPGVVPDWLLSLAAAATVYTIMFDLGLAIEPGEFRWVRARYGLLFRELFAVLVAVPALAWLVAWALDRPHPAEVAIMLMAIAPGAQLTATVTSSQAVVFDAPTLQCCAAKQRQGVVRVVGPFFRQEKNAIAVAEGSGLRKRSNQALLKIYEDGTCERIYASWFSPNR